MKSALKNWLILLSILTIGSLVLYLTEEHRKSSILDEQLKIAYSEIEKQETLVLKQEKNLLELNNTLKETLSKLQLITTFQDAGFHVSPEDVRDLLALSTSLPFGSPFSEGHRVTSEFGLRSISRYGWVDQKHLGIDLVPLDGDPTVLAPVDGYITDHGWSEIFGNYIEIQTTTGYRLFMGHLSRIFWPHVDGQGAWSIDPEQIVKKGTRLANIGQTGKWALGIHLHYEIWIQVNDQWVPLDPEEIINYVGGK